MVTRRLSYRNQLSVAPRVVPASLEARLCSARGHVVGERKQENEAATADIRA